MSVFRENGIHSLTNKLTQTRKTILLLLLICGDNAAATNPGPNSHQIKNLSNTYNKTLRYTAKIWDTWEVNRKYNEQGDKELYAEFRRNATNNRKERESGIRMKEEEFIEQNIDQHFSI